MAEYPTDGTRPYVCNTCGADGVKLWREYNTIACWNSLFCGECAAKSQKRDLPDRDGKSAMPGYRGGRSYCIGWLVPAIPTEDNTTFWGYTSAPEIGVVWWRSLPTRKS